MKDLFLVLYKSIREPLIREEAQDLVEYSLVFSMIALGTVAGMESLDSAIVQVFNSMSAVFASVF